MLHSKMYVFGPTINFRLVTAGPKSNLLIEDVTDGEGEDEELKLSTTSAADARSVMVDSMAT